MFIPNCPTCTNKMIPDPVGGWDCLFCRTEGTEPVCYKSPYINHCWNCGFKIDSRNSTKSVIPNMGYHCRNCKKDLWEWKQANGLLTANDLNIRLYYMRINIQHGQVI